MSTHEIAAVPAAVEAVAGLLRTELSAAETYDVALPRFEGRPAGTDLHRIRDRHKMAVEALTDRLAAHGGSPPPDAGPWGGFPPAAAGTAAGVGPAAVLYCLKRGEEHGLADYEAALSDPAVPEDCKDLIRSDLLPRARAHVLELDRLMAGK
jgi:hypothetical protein